MSISALNSSTSTVSALQTQTVTSEQRELRQSMRALEGALESGDLDSAQDAYDTLTSLLESKAPSDSSDDRAASFADMLEEVGAALEAGDVEAAQEAFVSGKPDGPPPPPPPGPPPSDATGLNNEEVQSAIGALADALQSGDADEAETAYSDLMTLLSNEETDAAADDDDSDTSSTQQNPFEAMLEDLGTALSTGNMEVAQSIFASAGAHGGGAAISLYA